MIARNNLISLFVLLAGLSTGFFIARVTGDLFEISFYEKDNTKNALLEYEKDPDSKDLSVIFLPFYGFESVGDMNNFALSQKMTGPFADLDSIEAYRVSNYFGADSMLVATLLTYLNSSFEIMSKGLYISDSYMHSQEAPGLRTAPVPWFSGVGVLEASSAVLSKVYYHSGKSYQNVIDEGFEAVKGAIALKQLLTGVRDLVDVNHAEFDRMLSSVDYEIELFRLLDYYRRFFMNYYRWIDTGDEQAKSNYLLAMGQCKSFLSYYREKYAGRPETMGIELSEAERGIRLAGNASRSVRWARVTVVLALFLLVMGIPGLLRDRAHRRFAGTLYFDGFFRPYLVSGLNSYHGTGRFAILLIIIYMLALVEISSFASFLIPLIIGGVGLLSLFSITLLINRGIATGRILVSLLSPGILLMTFVLLFVAVRGPAYFWYHFWVSDFFRLLFLSVFFMLLFRKIQVSIVLTRKWGGRNMKGSAALVFLVTGFLFLIAGLALLFLGFEESLTVLNSELLIFPGELSRITWMAEPHWISQKLPVWIVCLSCGIMAASWLILLSNRKKKGASIYRS